MLDGADEDMIGEADQQQQQQQQPLLVPQKKVRIRKKVEGEERENRGPYGVKRPLTSWVLFLQERRPELAAQFPTAGFGELAKMMSEEFKSLSAEKRAELSEKCDKDKERFKNELLAKGVDPSQVIAKPRGGAGGGGGGRQPGAAAATVRRASSTGPEELGLVEFPLSKIKKIMKLDPEVKQVGGDAIVSMARCAELFLASLANKSLEVAQDRGTKTISLVDVIHAVQGHECFEFLRLDLRKGLYDDPSDSSGIGAGRRRWEGGEGSAGDGFTDQASQKKRPRSKPSVSRRSSVQASIDSAIAMQAGGGPEGGGGEEGEGEGEGEDRTED